jgi:hypothetical protein
MHKKVLVILSHQKYLAFRRSFIVAAVGIVTKEFVVIHTKTIWHNREKSDFKRKPVCY